MPFRIVPTLVLLALALLAATATAATLHAGGISTHVLHRGQRVVLTGVNTNTTPCKGILQYANGKITQTRRYPVRNHRVRIPLRVSRSAAFGTGRWRVVCRWQVGMGSFVVVKGAPKTVSAAPKIVVDRQGYSQRPAKTGTSSLLSYGLLLRNSSPSEDAENVYVIVNAETATGDLVGSRAETIAVIPAGGTWALGNSINLRTQVPVARLELTIRVGAHEPKSAHVLPDFANVHPVPSLSDPGYVGEVDGEILNDTTPLTLSSARLSIVVLDRAGNPLGGGTGSSIAALPPGSRFVFTAHSGFSAIPLDQAASVLVSVEPRYSTPS